MTKPTINPGFEVKTKRKVNLPLFSMAHTPYLWIYVVSPMMRAPMAKLAKSADGCLTIVTVVDLSTGEMGNLILPAVVESSFRQYRHYVGKCFQLIAKDKEPGKDHRPVDVDEIEPPEGVELPAPDFGGEDTAAPLDLSGMVGEHDPFAESDNG